MSARHHAAQFADALNAFQCIAAWSGSFIPITTSAWGPRELMWRRGPSSDLAETVRYLDEQGDVEVRLGIPHHTITAGGVTNASMLWAYITGDEQLQRARRLRPLPSLVFAEGASNRRWLMWALDRVLSWSEVKDANRRIAYALRAVQKYGDPDAAWIPAVGTCVREGRARPVPVRCARLTTATYTPQQVVGRLKAPPEQTKWWDAA